MIHDRDEAIHVAAYWAKGKGWLSYLEDSQCTCFFFPSVLAMLEFYELIFFPMSSPRKKSSLQ